MNWYLRHLKTASPALMEPQRGRDPEAYPPEPSPYYGQFATTWPPKPEKPHQVAYSQRVKLFNYLKSKNILVPMFHGTSLSRYRKADKTGYLLGAGVNGMAANPITPESETKFVFMTPTKSYAATYAKPEGLVGRIVEELVAKFNSAEQALSEVAGNPKAYAEQGVVIHLQVPLHAITEVRDTILGGMSPREIGDRIDPINFKQDFDTNISMLFRDVRREESILTSYLGLPLKWARAVEPVGEPFTDRIIAELDIRQANEQYDELYNTLAGQKYLSERRMTPNHFLQYPETTSATILKYKRL